MAVNEDTKRVGIAAPRQFDRCFIADFHPADSLDYANALRLAVPACCFRLSGDTRDLRGILRAHTAIVKDWKKRKKPEIGFEPQNSRGAGQPTPNAARFLTSSL